MEQNKKKASSPKTGDAAAIKKLEKELALANSRAEKAAGETERLSTRLEDLMRVLEARPNTSSPAPVVIQQQAAKMDPDSPDRMVEIINLKEYLHGTACYIATPDRGILSLSGMGEPLRVRVGELSFIKNRHQTLFLNGSLAISDKDSDVAERYGLPLATKELEKNKRISKIEDMTVEELSKFYKESGHSLKEMILARFTAEAAVGNPKYKNLSKVTVLNTLSKGKMAVLYDRLLNEAGLGEEDSD